MKTKADTYLSTIAEIMAGMNYYNLTATEKMIYDQIQSAGLVEKNSTGYITRK